MQPGQMMDIVIPEGFGARSGTQLRVQVPAGVAPGQTVQVMVPN